MSKNIVSICLTQGNLRHVVFITPLQITKDCDRKCFNLPLQPRDTRSVESMGSAGRKLARKLDMDSNIQRAIFQGNRLEIILRPTIDLEDSFTEALDDVMETLLEAIGEIFGTRDVTFVYQPHSGLCLCPAMDETTVASELARCVRLAQEHSFA